MAANSVAKKSKASTLSDRGLRYINMENPMAENSRKQTRNKYDKDTNPEGIINLGTSENKLIADIVVPKLNEYLKIEEDDVHYYDFEGIPRFRKSVAEFFEYYMKPVEAIDPQHIISLNGCGTVVSCLGSVICDPGEGILIPSPYYGGFEMDLYTHSEIVIFPVHLSSKPNPHTKASFEITVKDLEEALAKAKQKNVTIRAILLCHPNNPLGTLYSEKQIRQCMEFAQKHSLHLISDEIYMLSIFKQGCSMTSALAISGLIDPERLHIIWGFSKDFGLSGIRAGILYSRNREILDAMQIIAYFHAVPSFLQNTLGKFISDHEWLDNTLIPVSHARLRECHGVVSEEFKRIGVPIVESCSGLFVWANLQDFIRPLNFENEKSLGDRLIDHGVYVNPGYSFSCVEPGWFRIVIASDPVIVKIGIQRIAKILKDIKACNKK